MNWIFLIIKYDCHWFRGQNISVIYSSYVIKGTIWRLSWFMARLCRISSTIWHSAYSFPIRFHICVWIQRAVRMIWLFWITRICRWFSRSFLIRYGMGNVERFFQVRRKLIPLLSRFFIVFLFWKVSNRICIEKCMINTG